MKHALVIGALIAAGAAATRAQDSLSAAKDLYASAAYEDALSTLSRVEADAPTADVARQADEYRAFCLFALGRTQEAETVAEEMIRRHPLARLDSPDASPRIAAMFDDVRKRLLPSVIREQFRSARTAIDSKKFSAAEAQLIETRTLIQDAGRLGVPDDRLGDLGELVEGFLGLIQSVPQRAATPSAAAQPVAPQTTTAVVAAAAHTAAPATAPAAAAHPPAAQPVLRPYTIADEGVTAPITVEQRLPAMPLELQTIARSAHARGMFDMLIDEAGRVVDATVRQSFNPVFDPLVIRSARDWKYKPATKDGVPVRFVKTILLVP